jgi:ceramide glucosyltransferase
MGLLASASPWALSALRAAALATGAFTAAFFAAAAAIGARRLRAARKRPAECSLPPVTVIKPLKGGEGALYDNLAAFCRQDYPCLQLLFCLQSPEDPALAVVTRLRKDFPSADIEVVVSKNRIGYNPKVNNMANAYAFAKYDLLLMSDADVRVEPSFLRRMAAPFADPGVGLVTSFYEAEGARGLWGQLEALSVNANFLPQAIVAAAFGMRFAMGAAMMVRRSAFDASGAFENLADHLADDFWLGESVREAGWRLELADALAATVPDISDAVSHFRHMTRWSRTIRLCNPLGHAGSVVLQGFSLLTLKVLLAGPDPVSLALLAAIWAAKAAADLAIARAAGSRRPPLSLLLIPLGEWSSFAAWLGAWSSSRVLWRGQLYDVEPQGRLVPVSAPLPRRPVPVEP